MKKFIAIMILIIIVLFCCFCFAIYIRQSNSEKHILHIFNKTDTNIYVVNSTDSCLDKNYPIKIMDLTSGEEIWDIQKRIDANSKWFITLYQSSFYENSENSIYLFIIKEEIVRQKDWSIICDSNLYNLRLKYTYNDLERINWQIVYR